MHAQQYCVYNKFTLLYITADDMSTPAAKSIIEMGFPEDTVRAAIVKFKKERPQGMYKNRLFVKNNISVQQEKCKLIRKEYCFLMDCELDFSIKVKITRWGISTFTYKSSLSYGLCLAFITARYTCIKRYKKFHVYYLFITTKFVLM